MGCGHPPAMSDRRGVILPAVLAATSAAAYLGFLTMRERVLAGQYETEKVFVAKVDIPERAVLREEWLESMSIPKRFVSQDAVQARAPGDVRQLSNAVTRVRIPKGNQVVQSALTSHSPETGISVRIPPGYRGAVLPIDGGTAALVRPGDRVDVLVTFDAVMQDGRREKATATILQNILVVGVGGDLGQGLDAAASKRRAERDERAALFSEKSTISLALNPLELEYLALAGQQGTTTIGVRGLGDGLMHPLDIATLRRLIERH